jgi:dTDP-4-amino-4,6-dideoxygalactose transaminase
MLRNYGQSSRYKADLAGGENSRLDEIQAAILSVKLRHLDRWNSLRQERASYYLRKLQEIGLPVRVLQENEGAKAAYHLFVIKTEATLRDKLMTSLHESGIQTLVHYPYPLPHQLAFARFNRDAVPVCEDLCSSIISLPFHQYLTFKEIDMIIASIGDFFRKI